MFKMYILYTYYEGISSYHPVRKTEAICASSFRRGERWDYGIGVILSALHCCSHHWLQSLPPQSFQLQDFCLEKNTWILHLFSSFSGKNHPDDVPTQPLSISPSIKENDLKISQKILWEIQEQMHVKYMIQDLAVRTHVDVSS